MDIQQIFLLVEHITFSLVAISLVNLWIHQGFSAVLNKAVHTLRSLPLVNRVVNKLIRAVLKSEVQSFTKQISPNSHESTKTKVAIPAKGIAHSELLAEMQQIKTQDEDPDGGKMFALVYTSNNDVFKLQTKAYDLFCEKTGLGPDHDDLVKQFHHAFMHENALNPMVFPSLRRFEIEVISMSASMLNGDGNVVGAMTSGGTESILMAMKTYRDRARALFPHIKHPEMVAPITIHPAHEKAASYFGFKIVHIPVDEKFLPDMRMYEQAITKNTIALLSSAPQYCHGVVDPIEELSNIAQKYSLPLHVDACFGGFMLPWVEKLGYKVPKFDFRLPGVTSMSADMHKYGYSTKGASVVLYRNEEYRRYQIFAYSQWPGGLFGSPSMAGTRPGGNIAAAWATLKAMGEDGYMNIAGKLMTVTEKLIKGIKGIDGLSILGTPHMTSFAIGSCASSVNMLALADILEEEGWKPERQQYPDSIHCTITPLHLHRPQMAEEFIQALQDAVLRTKKNQKASNGSAAMYGMVSKIPDKTIIDDFIAEFFNEMYK